MLPRIQILLALVTLLLHQILSLSSVSIKTLKQPSTPKKQQQQQQDVPSAINSIAFRAALKKPGSLRYLSDWRQYSQSVLEQIQHELAQNLPHPINQTATDQLTWDLGNAADDGIMPSFSNAGARAGYALGLLQSRARMLADLLQGDTVEPPFDDNNNLLFLNTTCTNRHCNLLSIGGGPGYDFLGAALVASFHNERAAFAAKAPAGYGTRNQKCTNTNLTIRATVYDYEPGWTDLVETMTRVAHSIFPTSSANNYQCHFGGRCDITLPLSTNINQCILKDTPTTDVFVCQYCVAENAAQLRRDNFVFFRNLLDLAPEGAVLVFTETTHRLWPELVAAMSGGFEVSFPFLKRGRNGVCLLVRKKQEAKILSDQHLATCKRFALHQEMNERRQQNGFVRQQKKKK